MSRVARSTYESPNLTNTDTFPECPHIKSWSEGVCDGECTAPGAEGFCSTHQELGTCYMDKVSK